MGQGAGPRREGGTDRRPAVLVNDAGRLRYRHKPHVLSSHRQLRHGPEDLGRREPGARLPRVALWRRCRDGALLASRSPLSTATLQQRVRLAAAVAEEPHAGRRLMVGRLSEVLLLVDADLPRAGDRVHGRREDVAGGTVRFEEAAAVSEFRLAAVECCTGSADTTARRVVSWGDHQLPDARLLGAATRRLPRHHVRLLRAQTDRRQHLLPQRRRTPHVQGQVRSFHVPAAQSEGGAVSAKTDSGVRHLERVVRRQALGADSGDAQTQR